MIGIRVDVNETIATGHLSRCISIAEALRALGEEPLFFLADENGRERLSKLGFSCQVLDTPWDKMEVELPRLLPLLREKKIDRLLIDSYQVTARYLAALREATEVWYLDDLNSFLYPVDALICYALYYRDFDYSARYASTRLLLGSTYVPLRSEFAEKKRDAAPKRFERLLLLSGGSDSENALGKILDGLSLDRFSRVDVVCGRYNPNFPELQKKYTDMPTVTIYAAVDNLIDLMINADLVISAGGTTLYELAAVGAFTVTYALAENQLGNVNAFDRAGLMKYAGDVRDGDSVSGIQEALRAYETMTAEERSDLFDRLQNTVDGLGAKRLARELLREH